MLRATIGVASQRLIELEAGTRTGASYGEKNPVPLARRNGWLERSWQTQAGTPELKIPKLRQDGYFPSFLEPQRLSEKASTVVTREAHPGRIGAVRRRFVAWYNTKHCHGAIRFATPLQRHEGNDTALPELTNAL